MLAYSAIAHAGYLLAAFAGLGASGIAAASFYTAAYAAMNVGIFAVVTLVSGYDEKLPLINDYRGLIYRSPLLGSLLIFFLRWSAFPSPADSSESSIRLRLRWVAEPSGWPSSAC